MRPEHLDLLTTAGRPALTPDGSAAVIAVTRPDVGEDRYLSELWVVPTGGGPARRLTSGDRDGAPAVSPDGRRVAFLRAGESSPPQIHVTGLVGGEPVALTDQPGGAGAPIWSPDGARLAWAARVPEPGRYGTEDDDGEKVEPSAEPPRLITEFMYRVDNLGYFRDRRQHVFVVDVPDEPSDPGAERPSLPLEPRQLTAGDHDDGDPVWSPDGTALAFPSDRHDTHEHDLRSTLHVVSVDGDEPVTEPTVVVAADLSAGPGFLWLDDGRLVLTGNDVGPSGRDFVGAPTQLWITDGPVSLDGGTVDVRPVTTTAFDLVPGPGALASDGGGHVVARALHRGLARPVRIGLDGVDDVTVLADGIDVTGHAVGVDGQVVVAASDHERVGDLATIEDGDVTWLTDLSARLRADAGVVRPVDVVATGSDGAEVHGWVLLPDSAEHGEGPYPLLLNIHGGPFAQYPDAFFDEAQVYAGAGYAVAMCNPRGSASYGYDHGRSIRGAMGSVDADDIVTFLDHVLADDRFPTDDGRVGVMGGSYGGYMTALLTTRTDRFAGAIVERGYLDAGSFVGSSDIGWFFPAEYHGSIEAGIEQSPMTHVDRVSTPTLVIHSEADWRTPIEQGQRWFTALKLRDVETELLVFPAESHELSRSGRPKHRVQRFEHILRWWGTHLPTG